MLLGQESVEIIPENIPSVLILEILKCGGQFPPPMSEKCGGLVNKNGNLYLRQ